MKFEIPRLAALSGRVWIGLLALVAAPIPLWFVAPHTPMGFPVVERGVPIFFILLAAGLLILARAAAVSWPFAALVLWATMRGAWHSFPPRTIQLLTLLLMAAVLYVAARELSDREARWATTAVLIGVAWEGVLGIANSFYWYPWMMVLQEHAGKPMGLLTHPNYYGSWMALALPLVWARAGLPAAAICFALIVRTISGGPVISAAAGALVMAWPLFGQKVRLLVAGIGTSAVVAVMTLHEWRLSGRREIWELALAEMRKWPLTGQGLGEWRSWAEQWNAAYGIGAGKSFVMTLQAHNEVLQLAFELGLVGLLLAGLWALQAVQASQRVWRAAPAALLPNPRWPHGLGWLAFGRAPLERAWIAVLATAAVNMLGSPTFHLPAQAALVLFAMARVQADAAALSMPILKPKSGNHHERAPRRRKEIQHVASPGV